MRPIIPLPLLGGPAAGIQSQLPLSYRDARPLLWVCSLLRFTLQDAACPAPALLQAAVAWCLRMPMSSVAACPGAALLQAGIPDVMPPFTAARLAYAALAVLQAMIIFSCILPTQQFNASSCAPLLAHVFKSVITCDLLRWLVYAGSVLTPVQPGAVSALWIYLQCQHSQSGSQWQPLPPPSVSADAGGGP